MSVKFIIIKSHRKAWHTGNLTEKFAQGVGIGQVLKICPGSARGGGV